MMKNLKLAYTYTFFSLIVPIIIVLLIITSRMWLLTAPIWMTVSYIVISFVLEKLIRDNLKLRKYIMVALQLLIAIGTAFVMYWLVITR